MRAEKIDENRMREMSKTGSRTTDLASSILRSEAEGGKPDCVRDLGLLMKLIHLRVDKEQRLENIVQMVT